MGILILQELSIKMEINSLLLDGLQEQEQQFIVFQALVLEPHLPLQI